MQDMREEVQLPLCLCNGEGRDLCVGWEPLYGKPEYYMCEFSTQDKQGCIRCFWEGD